MVTNNCWCSAGLYFRASFLFDIYFNDFSKNLTSIMKLFADDTFIFSVVYDFHLSAKQLNDDLNKISEWLFHGKMAFNPNLSKQAQEVVFPGKTHKNNLS